MSEIDLTGPGSASWEAGETADCDEVSTVALVSIAKSLEAITLILEEMRRAQHA